VLSSARTDRRPIDPPVIVQVVAPPNPSLFVSVALVGEDSDETVLFLEVGGSSGCATVRR
jgi:hypothetical protein